MKHQVNFKILSTEKLIYMYYENETRDSGWDKYIAIGTQGELIRRGVRVGDYEKDWMKLK
jgi:hypothetical protein